MRPHIIDEIPFHIKGVEFIPVRLKHFEMPILGFRTGDFAYLTDANEIPAASLKILKGVRYLVINALRKKKHISHFNLKEALNYVEMIAPEQAFLTHISHQMGRYNDVCAELPKGVKLAYDGLKVSF
jgi:phosphoribosyl 1,2-cyclic phosphate phosphodiesterase